MELIIPKDYDPASPYGRPRTQSNTYAIPSRRKWARDALNVSPLLIRGKSSGLNDNQTAHKLRPVSFDMLGLPPAKPWRMVHSHEMGNVWP